MQMARDVAPDSLETILPVRFLPLSAVETSLLQNVLIGDWTRAGPSRDDTDPANDPHEADGSAANKGWGPDSLALRR